MTEREKRMLTAARMLILIADSTDPRAETEGGVIAANWDMLGPRFRAVCDEYSDCPVLPI